MKKYPLGHALGWLVLAISCSLAGCQSPTTSPSPSGTAVPSAPTGLTASPGNAQVTVGWTAVSGATSYNLYSSTTSGVTATNGTKVSGITTNSSTQTGLTNGTTYYYVVAAVNAGGESTVSSQASATPQVPAPGAPTGVAATGGNSQAVLTWTAVAGATSYDLYYSTSSGFSPSNGTKVAGVTSPYTLTGLTNDTPYYFLVTAVNAKGQAFSSQAGATPTLQIAQWAQTLSSGTSDASLGGVTIDSAGNLYAVGYTTGTGTYGFGNGVTATGTSTLGLLGNTVLVKYNASGAAQWARTQASGSGNSGYLSVTVDGSGNLYAAGYATGTGTFGFGNSVTATGTSTSGTSGNTLLVKYNASGVAQWAQTLTSGLQATAFTGVVVDAAGNAYAAGYTTGTDVYGFGNGKSAAGTSSNSNPLLVKYDTNGLAQWAQTQVSGTSNTVFLGLTIDGAGNLYAVGYMYTAGTCGFGNSVSVTGTNSYNPLLVKFNSAGTPQWAQTLTSGTGGASFVAVTIDGSGNLYAAGYTTSTAPCGFGNGVTATGTNGSGNTLLVKYNSAGLAQWAQTLTAGSYESSFNGVTIDSSGNLYAAGYTSGTGAYGFGNGVTATGVANGYNPVLVKYSSAGVAQWAQTLRASTSYSQFKAVAIDASGNLYPVGYSYGTGTFGFGNGVTATGTSTGRNSLLLKYAAY